MYVFNLNRVKKESDMMEINKNLFEIVLDLLMYLLVVSAQLNPQQNSVASLKFLNRREMTVPNWKKKKGDTLLCFGILFN